MNPSSSRLPEANASTSRNEVPRAPPLPAPRPFPGAIRNAAYKFMGLPARNTSPQATRSEIEAALGSLNRFAALGATQDATASHRTGLNINTLAINERGTHALIGGKEIFKTVKIENGICIEDRNLRTTIRSTPTQASGEVRKVYSIDIADVAWAKSDYGDYVAAATTSGKIILYDLGHATLRATLLHEHARQVHRVTFNPHRGNLLLSGSQDGTVRLWDIREARAFASTLQSKRKFAGAGDGVRDVKWSPTDGVDFAFSTDGGWIQRWDFRYLKLPKIKIPAHQSVCTSLDWHPDGKHLLSAGVDKVMRVWDFSSTRKHKPVSEVRAPFPISNARWRPACESSMPEDNGARMCTQIATSYDQDHPVVHIWDLRRAALPFRELRPYAKSPTDLLWHSQDLLWTVGRDGVFLQSDIHHTAKVIDKRNLQTVAVTASGEIAFALQKRYQRRMPRLPLLSQTPTPRTPSMSQSPEYSLLSRSWADDSLDHAFLTVHPRRSSQSKSSTRYSSATATPPSGLSAKTVVKLDDILLHRQSFAPSQTAFQGINPLQFERAAFANMAKAYDLAFSAFSRGSFRKHVELVFADYMMAAKAHGQHQLAQTWNIVGFSAVRHLEKRLKAYLASSTAEKGAAESLTQVQRAVRALLQKTKSSATSPITSPASLRPVSSITHALIGMESNSNMTTPLARPFTNGRHADTIQSHAILPDPDTDQDLAPLPPSLTSHAASLHMNLDGLRPAEVQLTHENLQAMQSQGSTPMPIENGHSHFIAKPMLNLEADGSETHPGHPLLRKHDSGESFPFLIGSASSRHVSVPGSHADDDDERPASLVKEHPSRPLLRVNSESPGLSDDHPGSYSYGSPDLDMSPNTSSPHHHIVYAEESAAQSASSSMVSDLSPRTTATQGRSEHGQESIVQTVLQSMTLNKVNRAHAEIVELQASAGLDVEADEVFRLSDMLQELIDHYSGSASDAQTAAHMILTLLPLLPHVGQLEQEGLEGLLMAYIDATPASMNNTITLESVFQHIVSAGLQPLQIESILSTYHEQLLAQQSYTEAASLRRSAHPLFPAVYDYGLGDDSLTLTCGTCRKRVALAHACTQIVQESGSESSKVTAVLPKVVFAFV